MKTGGLSGDNYQLSVDNKIIIKFLIIFMTDFSILSENIQFNQPL